MRGPTPERTGRQRSDRPEESLTNKVAPPHDTADHRAWTKPMNERPSGAVFTLIRIATPIKQDRLRKCSLATLESPITLASVTAIPDNRRTANVSTLRRGSHVLGVDRKLLTELLDASPPRYFLSILWRCKKRHVTNFVTSQPPALGLKMSVSMTLHPVSNG